MTRSGWDRVPLTVVLDHEHGGRWTSLRSGDREWLWRNPDPEVRRRRQQVRRHDAFVDAGGLEELLPTVRGVPDHGDVWSRPWVAGREDGSFEVACPLVGPRGEPVPGRLARRVASRAGVVRADYRLQGPPGAGFLHAAHALLELGEDATVEVDPAVPVAAAVQDPEIGERPLAWPSGLDRLGPDDGSATCVLLRGCAAVDVVDGADRLALRWSADAPAPTSLVLWRNLGGWPQPHPYRSVGVEPMVGSAIEQHRAEPGQLVVLPAGGDFRWSLELEASRRPPDPDPR
jgi:hypothetical protein